MGKLTAIFLETESTASGLFYDVARIVYYDMHFIKDIHSDRDLRLIQRMAKDNGLEVVDNRKSVLE